MSQAAPWYGYCRQCGRHGPFLYGLCADCGDEMYGEDNE
jgi:hypothetical protein